MSILLILGGCAAQQIANQESLLAAAGFRVHAADTPIREASLHDLPPGQLVMVPRGGREAWVLPDPEGCHCLYVGGARAYQAYQQLRVRQRLEETQLRAAQLGSFDYAWGPWPSGPFGPYDPWAY